MTKPTITIEDIIAYHEAQARVYEANSTIYRQVGFDWARLYAIAAAHREAAALLRKGLDE